MRSILLFLVVGVFVRDVFGKGECESALEECVAKIGNGESCDTLPLPEGAGPVEIRASEGYNLEEIRDGVYSVTEGVYFMLIIYRSGTLVVVDMPENDFIIRDDNGNRIGSRINSAIEEVLDGAVPKRIEMIYSHHHYDHIGTGSLVYDFLVATYPKASLRIWASEADAEVLATTTSGRAPPPTDLITDGSKTLRLGRGFEIQMIEVGGHSAGDLLIYIPPLCEGEGIVFLVDVIFPGFAPFFSFALARDLFEYVQVHEKVLELEFETFIGGHLRRLGDRSDVELNLEFTRAVLSAGELALQQYTTFDAFLATAPENQANPWAILSTFRTESSRICADIVVQSFGCRLAGVDVILPSACLVAMDFIRVVQ